MPNSTTAPTFSSLTPAHTSNLAMGRKQKHVGNLNFEHKKRICQWKNETPSLTQLEPAKIAQKEFALVKCPGQATISTILRDQERYLNIREEDRFIRRLRPIHFPGLDEALANWVLYCQSRGVMLDGSHVKAKGVRILTKMGVAKEDQVHFSNGWLHSFQN
ncbi:unnamed protein product [Phytophthora fragariaefolia]|uniref:Unnamed protein product n=1 Tax=Phytophthora fragariaefolia TaxID=1490495 RepID=A0A9W6Y631_9STRA|nr:unnamed protein product [Phytophthora fragariaefolia]